MSTDHFDDLHPALKHHIVNSLGFRSLRPLQDTTIGPVLADEHVLAMAPTAGGKTEAAVFPLLSRMLSDDWKGLTVLYVCPLRALLNNLHIRLSGYAQLVGRSVGLWHGDTTPGERNRMLREPPDILLTTPESLEAMLVSSGVDHHSWFANVRSVVIDEAHAFVGDDRGWHLLALLARISHLTGRELQRIALSATIGNPGHVLAWLTTGCTRPGSIINPPVTGLAQPDITLDYVGSLENAALVVSRIQRGTKRLVFVDSRSKAEQLASALRAADVTAFVSHGSLGVDERRQTEAAFAEARDCVIVATSTLELGIDVGDLDHVIQIDSPATVASFLQRIGRTGRRPGTARNMTFLATSGDALVLAAGLLHRWSQGFVEPTVPPPLPAHLLAQQILALTLQESQIGSNLWPSWFGNPPALGADVHLLASDIFDHLVTEGYLIDGGGGMLSIGVTAEAELGQRHFMDLLTVFTAPPLFSVVHGRVEVGSVPTEVLLIKQPDGGPKVLLLGGRSWEVVGVDWKRRVINVQPSDRRGVARWMGGGAALGGELAIGVRDVLAGVDPQGVTISRRAEQQLAECRAERPWVRHDTTTLVAGDSPRWWTFAGQRANTWLAELLTPFRRSAGSIDGLSLALDPGTTLEQLNSVLSDADIGSISLAAWVSDEAAQQLKFAECLPLGIVRDVVTARLRDDRRVIAALREPIATTRA